MSAPKWAVGMQQIIPGLYAERIDHGCAFHVDERELCIGAYVRVNKENAHALSAAVSEVIDEWAGRAIPVKLL